MDSAKILIVDDDPLMRGTLAYKLRKEGYLTDTAEDGEVAIEKLDQQEFDLIISDVMMPFMGGFELLKTLKDRGNKVPVVILTALIVDNPEDKALELGADVFIPKPFSPREVSNQIRRLLKERRP